MIKTIIQFLSLFALIFFAQFSSAQLSKKHFIPPLTSSDGFTDQYIYISTPSTNDVNYTITYVGNISSTGTVKNGAPREIPISSTSFGSGSQLEIPFLNITSSKITNKGFIIDADEPVYVSVRVRSTAGDGNPFHAGALVSKGQAALGTEFRIGGFKRDAINNQDITFASIMATQNNTSISITVPSGITLLNGSLPSNIILNTGESYIVAARGTANANNLLGSLIESNDTDKPIVVNTGSAWGSFGTTDGNADYGFDQIVGADRIGKEYILVKGAGEFRSNNNQNALAVENVLIIPHLNNTEIFINGSSKGIFPAGEAQVINGTDFDTNGNMYIRTTNPVFVYQGISGATSGQANQGLFFVPPLSCESTDDVDEIAFIDTIGTASFPGGVTIVTNEGATVLINENPIPSSSFLGTITTSSGNYITYKVTGLSNSVSISSDRELYCAYFNENGAAATGSFYSGFPTPPGITFNTGVSGSGFIPFIDLTATNTGVFDNFIWQFTNKPDPIDADFEDIPGTVGITSFTPSNVGQYRLKGTISCTGNIFTSDVIPVSFRPNDFDGDSIIDNEDPDIDNDGILNIEESLGNVKINLTNPDTPILIFEDSSTNNSITSASIDLESSTNTFTGDADGNFSSTLATSNSFNKYQLSFTEKINVKITPSLIPTSSLPEDEFIIRIGPTRKNITIIDPDDQLLIDSNFNGTYESGITKITAYEVRFKLNSVGGPTPFQIVANGIELLDFQHKRPLGTTTLTTFNGFIELTTFAIDSDGDGIEDMFDLDSDNDGIPDLNETANDMDGDGIPNYLDVDSDNDGIFDLVEADHGNLDANNDGILDNANASTVRINGILDALETAPDSGIIIYNISDTDNDTIFNFLDLDSDNDGCYDVADAGFTDVDNNGYLDGTPFATDPVNGKVINNSDGYSTPNPNYIIDGTIIITDFNDVTFCEDDTKTISINSNADTFQWQVFNAGSWEALQDVSPYSGVLTKNLIITNTPLFLNNTQYRVVSSKDENTCSLLNPIPSDPITLTVNPLPIVKPDPQLDQCISVNNANPTVNLTVAEINISETPDVSFEYFEDNLGLNKITNFTSYPVTVNTTKIIYVKVTSKEGCSNNLVELKINVGQVNDNAFDLIQPAECDDYLDKEGNFTPGQNNDTDNITNFSLNENSIINSINPPINTVVLFYENETDRTNTINEIDIINFRNDITKNDIIQINGGIKFPIYYKILSTINNNCQGLGQFYLQINEVPKANTVDNIELCDDALSGSTIDGQNSGINLKDKIPFIFDGTTQTETDYKVTFHKTQIGASTNTDIISNDTNFTNDAPSGFTTGSISEQTIFVRVENDDTGCFNANTSFKIIIQPIPIVSNTISDLIVCDVATSTDADPRNRTAQNIDLTSMNDEIFAGKTNYEIEFYLTKTDAENRNAIVDPTNFQNTQSLTTFPSDINSDDEGIQTIFFVLFDKNGIQCPSIIYTFRVKIYPEPFVNSITSLSYCDDNNDGDDTNGIIQNIKLDGKIKEILGGRRRDDYNVTFHRNPSDAYSGDFKLPTLYTNSDSTETIYVRVQNILSGCINDRNSFQLIINPLPSFTVTTPQIICLNDLPLNISVENTRATYTYQWANESGTPLGTNDNINITTGGKYSVTATNSVTLCSRTEMIEVNESNIATLQNNFVTIIDESNNIGSQNNLSISIDTISNDLGPGDYQFAIENTDTNERTPFAGFQDEPLFENLEGGIYQIIVNDKNGCSPDTTLLVSVIQFPKFFTPNDDGENDTWVVKGANRTFYPNASINIFNRYGKLVAQVPIDSQGWNGTYNGTLLPSDDYWYNITLIPADTTKPTINKKGNFSLLRK